MSDCGGVFSYSSGGAAMNDKMHLCWSVGMTCPGYASH